LAQLARLARLGSAELGWSTRGGAGRLGRVRRGGLAGVVGGSCGIVGGVRRGARTAAVVACALLVAACSGGGSATNTTARRGTSPLPTAPPKTTTTLPGGTTPDGSAVPTGDWRPDLAACGDTNTAASPIEGTLRIGVVGPTGSGIEAAAAAGVVDGMRAYYEQANERSAIPGVTIELVVGDDRGDPSLTPEVLIGMLEDEVHMFSGVIGTSSSLAVLDELNARCVPDLFGISTVPQLTDIAVAPWTTAFPPTVDVEVAAYVANAKAELGDGIRFGVLHSDNDFGRAYLNALVELAGAEAVVAQVPVDPTTPVIEPIAYEPIGTAKPDVVLLAPDSVGCSTSMQSLTTWTSAEWTPQTYLAAPCMNRFTASLAADSANGVRSAGALVDVGDPSVQESPAVAALLGSLSKDIKPLFQLNAAIGWQIAELTVDVLTRASGGGVLSAESIITAARAQSAELSLGYPGIRYQLDGDADVAGIEQLQVVSWNAANGQFDKVGELTTGG
jgi:branched-chain amino acid transport system substrate-binding protein